MKKRISLQEAREFALAWLTDDKSRPTLRDTGLQKHCPRCERRGWVFVYEYSGRTDPKVIVWDGRAAIAHRCSSPRELQRMSELRDVLLGESAHRAGI